MVQFPPGWQRLQPGHYTVDEEFFLLSGDLHVNAMHWQSEQHGFVPADTLRYETRSDAGCTAYARFYGRPRWIRGSAARESVGPVIRIADWRRIAPRACAPHTGARLLHQGSCSSTWMLDDWPRQELGVNACAADALRLSDGAHCCGMPSAGQSFAAGPVLLHRIALAPVLHASRLDPS